MLKAEFELAIAPFIKGYFEFVDLIPTNMAQGHLYCITAKLVGYVSDNHGVGITKEAIKDFEKKHGPSCGFKSCQVPFEEHTYEIGILLKLCKNLTSEEAGPILEKVTGAWNDPDTKLAGLALLETPEKYRINK